MNHCVAQNLAVTSAIWAPPPKRSWATCWQFAAKQKWKTLICITASLRHSKQKFLRVALIPYRTLWFYASWRGLLILQKLLLMHGLLTQKSGSHSHFVTALPVLILVSLSSSFWTSSKWLYRGKCCDKYVFGRLKSQAGCMIFIFFKNRDLHSM